MKFFQICLAVLAAGLVAQGLSGTASAAEQPKTADAPKEEKIAIADVPKVVVDAVNTAQPGGKITDAEKETKNGAVVYEIDVTTNGKKFEVKVDAAGKVLSNKPDDDGDEKSEKGGGAEKKK